MFAPSHKELVPAPPVLAIPLYISTHTCTEEVCLFYLDFMDISESSGGGGVVTKSADRPLWPLHCGLLVVVVVVVVVVV